MRICCPKKKLLFLVGWQSLETPGLNQGGPSKLILFQNNAAAVCAVMHCSGIIYIQYTEAAVPASSWDEMVAIQDKPCIVINKYKASSDWSGEVGGWHHNFHLFQS